MPADPAHERRYQVFVSSTFVDLIDERRKVLEAILETQSFPAGMELFPSADDEQFEFIKREIESSDYYIVIVAGRYGSLAPDGLSFTEREYDYAIELKKPVMAFLHKDLGELKGKALEPTEEQRKRLAAFRAKVSTARLVKFYSNPDELKAQAWQALNSEFRLRPQTGWVRATNARRVQDLEEINRLQKRLMELESELSILRAEQNPRLQLACGEETIKLALSMNPITPDRADQRSLTDAPPVPTVEVAVSWNEVLLAIFRPAEHEVWTVLGRRRLLGLILSRAEDDLPPMATWVRRIRETQFSKGYSSADLTRIVGHVIAHLLGLGYVTMRAALRESGQVRAHYWVLTPEGLTHMALLFAGQRPAVGESPSAPHSS